MSREPPYKHHVKKHKRKGYWVTDYDRGTGKPSINKKLHLRKQPTKPTSLFIESIHGRRSKNARILDNSLKAPVTDDPYLWLHKPNEYDMVGIDTVQRYSGDEAKPEAYTAARINMNHIGGYTRVDTWDKEGKVHPEDLFFRSDEDAKEFIEKVNAHNETKKKGVEATYNMATGWMRIVFDEKPSRETLDRLKQNGFRYQPRSRAWSAKHSYHREEILKELAGKVEDVNITPNYEAKAERYENLASKIKYESDERYSKAKKLMDFIPIGQPILVGHHSEKRHRSDLNKIDRDMRKSFELSDKAKEYRERAENMQAKAEGRENPVTIFNRIEKLEKDLAKLKTYKGEDAKRMIPRVEERLRQEKAKYERVGGLPMDTLKISVGDTIRTPHGPAKVKKVNQKTVRVDYIGDFVKEGDLFWKDRVLDKKEIRGKVD